MSLPLSVVVGGVVGLLGRILLVFSLGRMVVDSLDAKNPIIRVIKYDELVHLTFNNKMDVYPPHPRPVYRTILTIKRLVIAIKIFQKKN
jgi:hypothetical protein